MDRDKALNGYVKEMLDVDQGEIGAYHEWDHCCHPGKTLQQVLSFLKHNNTIKRDDYITCCIVLAPWISTPSKIIMKFKIIKIQTLV